LCGRDKKKENMEVNIKNSSDKKQRAIVFGFSDSCCKGFINDSEDVSFFKFNTDEGIEIAIDGDKSKMARYKIIENIYLKPMELNSIEYTSNKTSTRCFYILSRGANGGGDFLAVQTGVHISQYQKELYPIIIPPPVNKIHGNQSLLFVLEPYEEINLKFNIKN